MIQTLKVHKTSSQQLKEVFTMRKKIGPYSKISFEKKINLIIEFTKVFLLFFSYVINFSRIPTQKREILN